MTQKMAYFDKMTRKYKNNDKLYLYQTSTNIYTFSLQLSESKGWNEPNKTNHTVHVYNFSLVNAF